ncbi:MAG: histidine kinase N-terminal 7TM domain-containing protein [Halobacteriales archaeon]
MDHGVLYIAGVLASSGLGAAVAAWLYSDDAAVPTRLFVGVVALHSVVGLLVAGQLLAPDPIVVPVYGVQKAVAAGIMPLWFLFALAYTRRQGGLSRLTLVAIGGYYVVLAVLEVTNPLHGLLRSGYETTGTLVPHLVGTPTLLYSLVTLPLAVFYFAGLGLVGVQALSGPAVSRRQSAYLFVGFLPPFVVLMANIYDVLPGPTDGGLVIVSTVSLAAVGWAVFRHRLFDLIPLARETVFEAVEDAVIVVDGDLRLLDYNEAAADAFPKLDGAQGAALADRIPALITGDAPGDPFAASFTHDHDDGVCHYDVTVSPLEVGSETRGYGLVARDVTENRRHVRRLEQQTERLRQHQTLQSTLQNVLVELSDRDRLERAVCVELAGDSFPLVCCCEYTTAGDVAVRTAGGALADHDQVLAALTADGSPIADALADGSPTVVHDIADVDAAWADPTAAAGVQSLIARPLTHEGVNYGALVVCSEDPGGFRTDDEQLVADVAQSLAYSIHTIEQEAVLRSDQPVRVTFGLWDGGSYLCELATDDRLASDVELSVAESAPKSPETATHYISVGAGDDGLDDDIRPLLDSLDGVRSVDSREAAGSADGVVARAQVERPTVVDTIVECGGSVQTVTVTGGEVQVVAEFAGDTVLSDVLARLRERLDTARFVSKTRVDPGDDVPRRGVDEILTEKQREALEVAYLNGFFDRPQGKTADEIADILGVSRSTFLSHVRTAEARLLGEYITRSGTPEVRSTITEGNR